MSLLIHHEVNHGCVQEWRHHPNAHCHKLSTNVVQDGQFVQVEYGSQEPVTDLSWLLDIPCLLESVSLRCGVKVVGCLFEVVTLQVSLSGKLDQWVCKGICQVVLPCELDTLYTKLRFFLVIHY